MFGDLGQSWADPQGPGRKGMRTPRPHRSVSSQQYAQGRCASFASVGAAKRMTARHRLDGLIPSDPAPIRGLPDWAWNPRLAAIQRKWALRNIFLGASMFAGLVMSGHAQQSAKHESCSARLPRILSDTIRLGHRPAGRCDACS